MDAFSRVIELADVRGSLDLRCQLAGSFILDHASGPVGEAPFHLLLAGQARVRLPDDTTLELTAGDLLLLPRGSAHVMQSVTVLPPVAPVRMDLDGPLPVRRNTDGPPELDLLCGRFTYGIGPNDLIMRSLPEVLHLSLTRNEGGEGLRGVVDLLRAEASHLQPGASAVVTALSQALFVLAMRAYAQRENMPASLLVLLGDARLSRAVLAMLQHPEKAWSVASLAEQAMMSRATFARHFAAGGDTSPMELLTILRMQVARGLLARGDLVTAEVAERVGYQSEAAFAKVFAQRIGVTPATYRRQHRSTA